MNLEAFLRERAPDWQALDQALSGRRRADAEQALAMGRSYRAAVADLAVARRQFPGDPVVDRLERLVLSGRQAIYTEPERSRGGLRRFAARDYWRLVIGQPAVLATSVLALDLDEASAKVRTGGPIDDEDDVALRVWAGVLPSRTIFGPPRADEKVPPLVDVPAYITTYER